MSFPKTHRFMAAVRKETKDTSFRRDHTAKDSSYLSQALKSDSTSSDWKSNTKKSRIHLVFESLSVTGIVLFFGYS